jgi:hypothetical protein
MTHDNGRTGFGMLQEVLNELNIDSNHTSMVSDAQVRRWMESSDADTLGATYVFLSKPEHVARINPPIEFDSVFNFMLRYYIFCMKENPKSAWANSNYSAGADMVGWFVSLWEEKRDERYFEKIKASLEELYINSPADTRKCVEHAVVEHLFERKAVRRFFSNWQHNPQLRPAYDEGMLWVRRGGQSPLTKSYRNRK